MKAQKTILPLMKKSPRRRRLSQPRQNLLQNLLFLKMRVVRMKFQRRTSQLSQMLQRRLLSRKIAAQERKNHLKKRRVLMRRKTLKPQRKILMWKWLMLHHLRKWPLNSMDQIKFDWP